MSRITHLPSGNALLKFDSNKKTICVGTCVDESDYLIDKSMQLSVLSVS